MKKFISLSIALILCFSCVGCGASEKEGIAAETKLEVVLETVEETMLQETVAVTEADDSVTEIASDTYFKNPNIRVGWKSDDVTVQVYDCRMYPMENGITRFEVDYKTVAGLQPVVFAHLDDGDDVPDYWYEVENLTTEEECTLVFEMETEFLFQTFGPDIHFRNDFGFEECWVLIYHTEQMFRITEGNPVGEAEELNVNKEGNVTVYGAWKQMLDNGYIRFTVDCKPQKNRYISFYNPPEGSRIMCVTQEPTSGQRETIVVDVRAEDVMGLNDFNFNFFNGDAPVARIYLSSPVDNFEELVPDYFAAFIGGNGKLAVMYYGVIDEAVLGATLTAKDGASVAVTEKILDKNGDGHTLMWFNEYKAKRNDTISVTLSKEGYQDIALNLLVH